MHGSHHDHRLPRTREHARRRPTSPQPVAATRRTNRRPFVTSMHGSGAAAISFSARTRRSARASRRSSPPMSCTSRRPPPRARSCRPTRRRSATPRPKPRASRTSARTRHLAASALVWSVPVTVASEPTSRTSRSIRLPTPASVANS